MATTSDRVYTFRAPVEFADRLADARRNLQRIFASGDPRVVAGLAREFQLAFAREVAGADSLARDQSSLIRGTLEATAVATARVASWLDALPAYECAAADPESGDWAEAAARLAEERWREG